MFDPYEYYAAYCVPLSDMRYEDFYNSTPNMEFHPSQTGVIMHPVFGIVA